MAKIVRRELAAQTPRCSTLVGVGGARLLEARLVARAPASNRVGMECGHRVAVSAVNLKAVADVNVAVAPEVGAVLPRSIDDVTVESDANWLPLETFGTASACDALLADVRWPQGARMALGAALMAFPASP